MLKFNTLLSLDKCTPNRKALCRKDLSPAASALRHNLSLNFDKRENGTGMKRWKGERSSTFGFACDQTLGEISGPLHANMCLIQSHYQTTNLKHNSQWAWVWSCTCARSPVPTHNRCVPASGVRVQPECRCASRGRPQLHFGRLGTRCWAARSPPMHEQRRRDESRGPGNQHDLGMDGTGGHFTAIWVSNVNIVLNIL